MLTITQLARKSSPWTRSPSIRVGSLLLAALAVSGCSPPSAATDSLPVAESFDATRVPVRAPQQNFYEDNPTYISKAVDDGFWKTSPPAVQNLDPAVLERGATALLKQPSALSLMVIRNGTLVMERYFHGSEVSHSTNVHSASKSIVSALVGIALERGLLGSLDQTLEELLPNYRLKDSATADITLRDLLNMTSGLGWVEDETEYTIQKSANWVQAILDLPLAHSPGTTFNYSTGNVHLLSAILTQATGKSLPDFAREVLFNPLGITFEHWGKDPQGIASGGYNLYLTPRALGRFAMMAYNGGSSGGKQLVPSRWIASSTQPQEPASTGYHYGFLYWLPRVSGHAVAKMWGFGGQFAYLIPDVNMLVILTNNTHDNYPEPDGDAFVAKYILPAIKR